MWTKYIFQFPIHSDFTPTLIKKVHSPTGPGFISMSPLINSSRSTTTPTTLLPRPVGTKLRETCQTLEWDDGHLIFDHTTLFWRTMAGSTLLGNGSRWVWPKVMWWTWLMLFVQYMVVSCTCSVASSNMGSMRMHTPTITAQLVVTWHSWQWR